MDVKVCKFGGSSLADAGQFERMQRIVADDDARRYVVPSAPGRRDPEDRKVTDLLYLCHEDARQRVDFTEVFDLISERYRAIVSGLDLDLDLDAPLAEVAEGITRNGREDLGPAYAASRGEFLNGHVVAAALDFEFIDAAEIIRFDSRGRLDEAATARLIAERTDHGRGAVIPGFYGADADGTIHTFSRGGSDVTGALVAEAVGATVYENWTDVSGLLMADPSVIDNPAGIDVITYQELRELAYMGATVLHDEAIFPVRRAGIPVNIRNTNEPDHPGTRIVSEAEPITHEGNISGIAGRRGFAVIAIEKALMNAEIGFGRRVLSVLEGMDISFEHMPTGIDTMSVVVTAEAIEGREEEVLHELECECHPDSIELLPDLALIATVGRGMAHTPGMAARLFGALGDAGVNIRMIDQGSSEINIIVGVDDGAFDTAVGAIYDQFVDA